jgi:hypothetical protein
MKKTGRTYKISQFISTIFMVLALLWLTISAPFVYEAGKITAQQEKLANPDSPVDNTGEESSANPFGNSTEEKTPGGSNSFSEEYLHDHHTNDCFSVLVSLLHKRENAGTYIAYHGELLVPPPNLA